MTPADAPVTYSVIPRDARRGLWGPDPLGWLTRPARRLYVDARRRPNTPPAVSTPDGSGAPTIGASVHERPPGTPPLLSRRHAWGIGRRPPSTAHAVAHGPHGTANSPPMHTGVGRFRTTGLNAPAHDRLVPMRSPLRDPPQTTARRGGRADARTVVGGREPPCETARGQACTLRGRDTTAYRPCCGTRPSSTASGPLEAPCGTLEASTETRNSGAGVSGDPPSGVPDHITRPWGVVGGFETPEGSGEVAP